MQHSSKRVLTVDLPRKMTGRMDCVIVANAPDLDLTPYLAVVRAAGLVIAADGGARPLLVAGLLPQIVVGDLDSLDTASIAVLRNQSVELRRYPRAKDQTDFELALLLAAESDATQIVVIGALGGRWDHTLANIWLLAHPALIGRDVRLLADRQVLSLVRTRAVIDGQRGDTISLIPLTPQVHGVTTFGLQYPLEQATLHANQARGVSNVLLDPPGEVLVADGLLVLVQHDDGGAYQWNTPAHGE